MRLDSGSVVELGPSDLKTADERGGALIAAEPAGNKLDPSGRRILEVAVDEYEELLMVLEGGVFLENSWDQPGGNQLWIGMFEDWEPDDWKVRYVRFWDGQPVDLRAIPSGG